MQRCLQLALPNIRNCAPNPSVGAVLVHEGKIIAEGCTSPYGGPHAEVNCINNVKTEDLPLISKSTLYVSLEPCSHFGKTPPCANLIIEKQIPKVVVGSKDPNPLVAGRGIELLKNAGIDVVTYVLEKECIELNKRFYTFHTKKRPYIILKWAQSVDGFFAPDNNTKLWISNGQAKTLVHQWRSEEMGIMVGSNTGIVDNPRLNVRLVEGISPARILIDRYLKTPFSHYIYDGSQRTIVFSTLPKPADFPENVELYPLNFTENWTFECMNKLFELNIQSLIIEGGATILKEFIFNNLWDETRIITGNVNFGSGLAAPDIPGKEELFFEIGDNSCKIIRNLPQ